MVKSELEYVMQTAEGSWRIAGTRVSLDSVVRGYLEGQSPKAIGEDFPTLSLEQIYGAIAFYLHNRREIDKYLAAQDDRFENLRREHRNDPLIQRLRKVKTARRRGSPG